MEPPHSDAAYAFWQHEEREDATAENQHISWQMDIHSPQIYSTSENTTREKIASEEQHIDAKR